MNKRNKIKVFVVTGMSGAGKSQALKCFEDFGFYCIDNLPADLMPFFAKLLDTKKYLKNAALGLDIREGRYLKGFVASIESLIKLGIDCKIIFLDAADSILLQRFSETRHKHPLGKNLSRAIKQERRILSDIKSKSNKVIDTSNLTLGELKEIISAALELKRSKEMNLSVTSFGFKYGIPLDADIVMDVRFLPNPNYVPHLKKKTGLDKGVGVYLESKPMLKKFIERYSDQIKDLIPLYIKEGKSYLTIAIGCTGGRHRSVFISNQIAKKMEKFGFSVSEHHRDIRKTT